MSEKINIEQILVVSKTLNTYWDVNVPVPEDKYVFDADNKVVKKGDGVKLLSALPIYLDLTKVEAISKFYKDLFPILTEDDKDRILSTDDSNKFSIDKTTRLEDIISKKDLADALAFYSDKDHKHPVESIGEIGSAAKENVGLNPGEVPVLNSSKMLDKNIIPPNITLNDKDSDLISFLLLNMLIKENINDLELPSGIVDEFLDLSKIDIYASGDYEQEGHALKKMGPNFYLVSTPFIKEYISPIYIYFRGRVLRGLMNKDIIFEVSKGNTDWSQCLLEELPIKTQSNVSCYKGIVNLGEMRKQEDIILMDYASFQDVKGSITRFTVDKINSHGHFNQPVNPNIKVGYTIHIVGIGKVIIKSIHGDGTDYNDIEFDGVLPVKDYDNIKVSPCTYTDSQGITLSGLFEDGKYKLIPEFGSVNIDLTGFNIKHIFSQLLSGDKNGLNYQILLGYDDGRYLKYDKMNKNFIECIKEEGGAYKYYNFLTNNWVTNIGDIENTVSKAYTLGGCSGNIPEELGIIPINIKGKKLTNISITINSEDQEPLFLNGIKNLELDLIQETGIEGPGNDFRWRCRTTDTGNIILNGIRIRY